MYRSGWECNGRRSQIARSAKTLKFVPLYACISGYLCPAAGQPVVGGTNSQRHKQYGEISSFGGAWHERCALSWMLLTGKSRIELCSPCRVIV